MTKSFLVVSLLIISLATTLAIECDDTKCVTCQDPKVCTTCLPGYALQQGVCSTPCVDGYGPSVGDDTKCMACEDPNALKCPSGSNKSESCQDGYEIQMIDGLNFCIPKGSNITTLTPKNCAQPDTTNPEQCKTCKKNYQVDTTGQCTICTTGYFANSLQECVSPTQSRCSEIKFDGEIEICSKCDQGWAMELSAPNQGCFKCDAANKYGNDLTNQTCKPCTDLNCADCSSDRTKCSTCGTGFQIFNGACKANCKVGETLNIEGTCTKCSTVNCATCQNIDVCDKCLDNYTLLEKKCNLNCGVGTVLSSDGLSCVPCNKTCKSCIQNADKCTECQPAFNFDQSKSTCTPQCTIAGEGYDSGNLEKPCGQCLIKDCSKCQLDVKLCQECAVGTKLDPISKQCTFVCSQDGQGFDTTATPVSGANATPCQACQDTKCQSCNQDLTICSDCLPGFKMVSGVCTVSCATAGTGFNSLFNPTDKSDTAAKECLSCETANCQNCQSDYKVCTQCLSKFGIDASKNSSCSPCSAVGCDNCSESFSKCITCLPGFNKIESSSTFTCQCSPSTGLNETTKLCEKCSDNCADCTASSKSCNKCNLGFGQSPNNGPCAVCVDSNCRSCLGSSATCEECQDPLSFLLLDGKCIKRGTCPPPTGTNVVSQGTDANGQCSNCVTPNCANCLMNNAVCQSCLSGFVLQSSSADPTQKTCEKNNCIVPNCLTCPIVASTSSATCDQCNANYFQNAKGDSCDACSAENCKTCGKTATDCVECQFGFIQRADTNTCVLPCIPGCGECDFKTNVCIKCSVATEVVTQQAPQIQACKPKYIDPQERECSGLIKNCSACQMVSEIAPFKYECTTCTEGFEVIKSKETGFTQCRPIFEDVKCEANGKEKNLEGCAACRRRISQPGELSITVIRPVECVQAFEGYTVCNIGNRVMACYVKMDQYTSNNIQAIPFCSQYNLSETTLTNSIRTLTCTECIQPYILDEQSKLCMKDSCFEKYTNCQTCSSTAGCSLCAIGFVQTDSTDQTLPGKICQPSNIDCSVIPNCKVCQKSQNYPDYPKCTICAGGIIAVAETAAQKSSCEESQCADNQYFQANVGCLPCQSKLCASCDQNGACTQCIPGFNNAPTCDGCEQVDTQFDPTTLQCKPICVYPLVFNRLDQTCKDPLPNCSQSITDANNVVKCSSCNQGYGLQHPEGICQQCPKGCTSCKFDANNSYCGKCADGYTLSGTSCTEIVATTGCVASSIPNCKACSQQGTVTRCETCFDGFKSTPDFKCIKICQESEYSIPGSGTCGKCSEHKCSICYMLNDQSTTSIATQIDASNIICQKCQSDFVLNVDSGQCLADTCQKKTGFFSENGICLIPCPRGCSACTSQSYCTQCDEQNGFKYADKGLCLPPPTVVCPADCLTCKTSGFCEQCKDTHYWSLGEKQCLQVPTCNENQFWSFEEKQCLQFPICKSNQYATVDRRTCVDCSPRLKNCEACNIPAGFQEPQCTQLGSITCESNEYEQSISNGTKICIKNPVNCLTVDSNGSCTSCVNKLDPIPATFGVTSVVDPKNTSAATTDTTTQTDLKICPHCPLGQMYNAENKECVNCQNGCIKCEIVSSTATKCLTCKDEQMEIQQDGTCQRPAPVCTKPRVLDSAGFKCICPPNSIDSAANTCECAAGLTWNDDSSKCIEPSVTTCFEGTYRENTQCSKCLSYKYSTNADGTPDLNSIQKQIGLCNLCKSAERCDRCVAGYYLDSKRNACFPCGTNCAQCSNEDGKCKICLPGSFLNEGTCDSKCAPGTLPTTSSFWTLNSDLFLNVGISKNQIYDRQNLMLKPFNNVNQCGDAKALDNQRTVCSQHTTITLPWLYNDLYEPYETITGKMNKVTLECKPCQELCAICVPQFTLVKDGGKCVRECPFGSKPVINPDSSRYCYSEPLEDQKLDTQVVLLTRLPELVNGLPAHNYWNDLKLAVKQSISDQQVEHSWSVEGIFYQPQDPADIADATKYESIDKSTFLEIQQFFNVNARSQKDDSLTSVYNTFKPDFIYRISVTSQLYSKDGATVVSTATSYLDFVIIAQETEQPLSEKLAKIAVSLEQVESNQEVVASISIVDFITFPIDESLQINIQIFKADVPTSFGFSFDQDFFNLSECSYKFTAPFVTKTEQKARFYVRFTIFSKGIQYISERILTVTAPTTPVDVQNDPVYADIKQINGLTGDKLGALSTSSIGGTTSTTSTSTNSNLLNPALSNYVNTVKSDLDERKNIKPTASTENVKDPINNIDKSVSNNDFCKPTDEASCFKKGKCVVDEVTKVAQCICDAGFIPSTNCQISETSDEGKAIIAASNIASDVLRFVATSIDDATKAKQTISNTDKNIVLQVLQDTSSIPPVNTASVIAQSAKTMQILVTITSAAGTKSIDQIKMALLVAKNIQNMRLKDRKDLPTAGGRRVLTEDEQAQQDSDLQFKQSFASIQENLARGLAANLKSSAPVSEVSVDTTSIRATLHDLNDFANQGIDKITESIAVSSVLTATGGRILQTQAAERQISVPLSAVAGQKGKIAIVTQDTGDFSLCGRSSTPSFTTYDNLPPFSAEVHSIDDTDAENPVVSKIQIQNLGDKPITMNLDISQLDNAKVPRFMTCNPETYQWEATGCAFDKSSRTASTTHLSVFILGTSDVELDNGNTSTPSITDDTANKPSGTNNTTNTSPKPTAVTVDSTIISVFSIIFVLVAFVF